MGAAVAGARLGIDVGGKTLWADEASGRHWEGAASGEITPAQTGRLRVSFDAPSIEWDIEFRWSGDGKAGIVASTIHNRGKQAVRLGRCRLAELSDREGSLRLGSGAETSVVLAMSGWSAPSKVLAVRAEKRRQSKTVAQVYNPEARTAVQLGFLTFDRINTEHEVWWDQQRQAVSASAYCDFERFALQPGASVESEQLGLQAGSDPVASLEHWADLVQAHYHPAIWPKIPGGWVGWSWVDPFHSERYEDVVRRNTRAIRERLPGLDLEYVWVSLGNLVDREPGNWLSWNRELFPSGPEALVRDLSQQHFRLGLWAGAFWLSSRLTDEVARLRDALLLRDGKPITVPHRELGAVYVLDPTHPKTQAFLRDVFATYRKWGVRYYMLDFLYAISGSTPGNYRPDSYYDQSLIPGPQAYRAGLRAIREAAGTDTYLLSSTGPTLQNIGLMDAVRAGNDYGEGRALDGPGKGFYPATFVINRPDYWTSHRGATDALATNFFTHRKLYLADTGNVLTIDKPVSLEDARISATIFGINGGPLMLGDDIERMSPERLEMVKQLFPRLPECAVPLDLFQSAEPDYPKLFDLKIRREWGSWDLLALFNYGSDTLRQEIGFDRLGLDPGQAYTAWDFWDERYLGVHSRGLTVEAAPRSVRLLRIARAEERPWLLSTDMHVRQGQAEIEDVRWDAARHELTVRARRPAGYKGNVYVRVPKGLALRDPKGLWIAKDGYDGSLIVRCALEFSGAGAAERVLGFVKE